MKKLIRGLFGAACVGALGAVAPAIAQEQEPLPGEQEQLEQEQLEQEIEEQRLEEQPLDDGALDEGAAEEGVREEGAREEEEGAFEEVEPDIGPAEIPGPEEPGYQGAVEENL